MKKRLWTEADDDILDAFGVFEADPGLGFDPLASTYDVECGACGAFATVEPDAAYSCGECGKPGGWASPLRVAGMI